jgi:CRISPR/Cas system-associated endonuclease Cas1
MEEFRPIVADSAVLTAINNGIVKEGDFLVRNTGVTMKDAPKRKFIQVIERRFDELATHPVFATRLSMRRIMEVQARLLARHLAGELPRYLPYRPR